MHKSNQAIIGFIGIIMIIDAFSQNTDTLQSKGFGQNYALKSALLSSTC